MQYLIIHAAEHLFSWQHFGKRKRNLKKINKRKKEKQTQLLTKISDNFSDTACSQKQFSLHTSLMTMHKDLASLFCPF